MSITIKQGIGILLIIIGLFTIFWDILNTYYYFSAVKEFPQVFAEPQKKEAVGSGSILEEQIQQQLNNVLQGYIPENTISGALNMTAWITFAFFLLYAGGKMITIGNGFLKDS